MECMINILALNMNVLAAIFLKIILIILTNSQHKLMNNTFFNVDTGGWQYGIWDMCLFEILPQFYEWLLPSSSKYLFGKMLRSAQLHVLYIDVDILTAEYRNQCKRVISTSNIHNGYFIHCKNKKHWKVCSYNYIALYLNRKESNWVLDTTYRKNILN